jgi:hypothetical protein
MTGVDVCVHASVLCLYGVYTCTCVWTVQVCYMYMPEYIPSANSCAHLCLCVYCSYN